MSVHKFVDKNKDSKKRYERVNLGTRDDGIVLDITRKGLEINGYYTKYKDEGPLSLLREPLVISWEDLEKMRKSVLSPKKKDNVEYETDIVDEEYLEKLPKVHINNSLYYVDVNKKQIRPVDRPHLVSNLKST